MFVNILIRKVSTKAKNNEIFKIRHSGLNTNLGPIVRTTPQSQEKEAIAAVKSFEEIAWADFFNNLKTLYGLSFPGKQIFMAEGGESWEDKPMVMFVDLYENDEDITMYGGYFDPKSATAFYQVF